MEELTLFFVTLDRLRSCDDRHPFLNILFFRMALCAEHIEILLCAVDIAVQPEEQIRSCNVCGSISLRCVRPVYDIGRAVVCDDDILRVEVAVAKFCMLRHTVKTGMKLIACCCVKIRLRNLAIHLVLQLCKERAAL